MLVKAPRGRLGHRGAPAIVPDDWTLVDEGPARPGLIAPLSAWLESPDGAGVWVEGDAIVEDVAAPLLEAPVIAVRFPALADGRGLTFARLLRTRYGYDGELRAIGEIVPDLTEYMFRCGFDAFVLADRRQAESAIACIQRMSDHYQGSVRQPLPAYRRVAEHL
ncbi:MAG: DUF934 domain-containing protein [Gammaproteobacteria bacterium]|nr:DUF934 domain-containing protein [Gammaproteobacteria bacterium]